LKKLSELPAGSLVKDINTKHFGKPIVWRVVAQSHESFPVDSTTLMSDKIVDVRYFDNKEPSNIDGQRKMFGNNRWDYSNIRQWLNTDSPSPWWKASHIADAPPDSDTNGNEYADENGFMTDFSDGFKNHIMTTTLTTLLPNADTFNMTITTDDKVFLFSITEMDLGGTTGKEGKVIPYLSDPENRIGLPTTEAVTNSGYKSASLNTEILYNYWLRSCMPSFSYIGYRINTNGQLTNSPSNNGQVGIRPATNLDANTDVAYQDEDGVWVLAFGEIDPTDLSSVAFELKETVSDTVVQNEDKFSGTIKLDWNIDDLNIDYEAEVSKNGVVIPYERLQDLSEEGDYSAVITATDRAFTSNQRVSSPITFSIVPGAKDLDNLGFKVINNIDSTIMADGTKYVGAVQPTWNEIKDVTITVTLTKDGEVDNTFSKNKYLGESGNYILTYLLTDNNHPENQHTGTISFTIDPSPFNWGDLNLNLKDELTGTTITTDSKFSLAVKPTWEEKSIVTYSYTLKRETSLISYTKGETLSTIAKYTINFSLVDKNYSSNTFTLSVPFEVIPMVTEFGSFAPEFIDFNEPEPNTVISEGIVFKGETVKPTWRELPTDISVISYSLTKDELVIPFTHGVDEFIAVGDYRISLLLGNAEGKEQLYTRNFKIRDTVLDLSDLVKIVTDFDNSEIYENRQFEDENVLPNWNVPEGVSIFYTLKYNGLDTAFVKGITVLSDKGEYELELILEETQIPTNTLTITRHFKITDKAVDMGDINMTIVNILNFTPINNGDVYKGITVKPFWFDADYPESLIFESWITHNGVRREYVKSDDEDVLTENGDYILEVRAFDINFPNNYKMATRNFKIIPESIDMSGKDINIKDKITDNPIEEGEVFRGEIAAVQPFWASYPELSYDYKLYFNNSLKTYIKGDILRDKGNYRLVVTAEDPSYPENKIQVSRTFSILDDIDPEASAHGEAYLNGLPYVMGTPITESGDYNLLVVRRKDTNFQVSMSEVDFKVVDLDEEQKPLIIVRPDVIPAVSDMVSIRYPDYGSEYEYKINNGPWTAYLDQFEVTDNCTVYARYRDPMGHFVEANRDITNIDKMPPDPPNVLGFKDGVDTYYTVLPTVEFVYGVDFTATLNGQPYELGTPIYNEGQIIKDYTLVVVAKKRLNGLTASTIVNFTLDSIPPDPPIITGVLPNVIQENARPDVLNPDHVNLEYDSYLNGRIFRLGTYMDDPNSYNLSVTATKKVNGLRATSIVVFTILWEIPDPIEPLRITLEPLIEANKDLGIDGELIVDRVSGHISIYDDGYLISKTRELEMLLDILDKRIIMIQSTLQHNETRIDSLKLMRLNLRRDIDKLRARNYAVRGDIDQMKSIMERLDFVDIQRLRDFDDQLIDIDVTTQNIRGRIDKLKARLNGKVDLALQIMAGLQTNSSFIGEVIWLKNNPNYPRT
jgi:Family of unknown function (DUF6273)